MLVEPLYVARKHVLHERTDVQHLCLCLLMEIGRDGTSTELKCR